MNFLGIGNYVSLSSLLDISVIRYLDHNLTAVAYYADVDLVSSLPRLAIA